MPVPAGTYKYVIGNWEWRKPTDTDLRESWCGPRGNVAKLEMRNVDARALKGVVEGSGFFAMAQGADIPLGAVVLTNDLNSRVPASSKQEWAARLGISASDLDGATLLDDLWAICTRLAPQIGIAGILPNTRGEMNLYLPGHSLVRRDRFTAQKYPHVVERAKADFLSILTDPKRGQDVARRFRNAKARKLGIAEREIGLLPPSGGATITESFDQADSTTLGPDLTWTETDTDWETINGPTDGVARATLNNLSIARAEHDLDTDDHYVQVTVTARADFDDYAVLLRYSSSAQTYYEYRTRNENSDTYRISSVTAGTATELTAIQSQFPVTAAPYTKRGEVDGSDITGLEAGNIEIGPYTDSGATLITGNTRTGILSEEQSVNYDDFEAGDLAAAFDAALMASRQLGSIQPVQMPVEVMTY